ncbi:MAG: T9SS type A sorting domain-containing protein [Bacteroidales bacterium]
MVPWLVVYIWWRSLSDGARGDGDLDANGTILDPGGPVVIASSVREPEIAGFEAPVIYPNPCQDILKMEFNAFIPSDIIVDLFDSAGRKIGHLINDRLPPGRISLTMDLSSYNAGIYYLSITDGKSHFVKKIVKINQ